MRNAGKAGLTTRKPEIPSEEMLNAIGHSLSDLASPNNRVVVEDKDDNAHDTELGRLSEADEYGYVMGTTCKTVEYRLEPFRQKEICQDALKHPGWGDTADAATWWSWKADSPVSTLHRTSPGIQKELITKSGFGLRSIGCG